MHQLSWKTKAKKQDKRKVFYSIEHSKMTDYQDKQKLPTTKEMV